MVGFSGDIGRGDYKKEGRGNVGGGGRVRVLLWIVKGILNGM